MNRRAMVVAGMMVLGLVGSLSARPVFPDVAGEWVLTGVVNYRIRVHGSRDRRDVYLPPVAASFEPTGDFAMEWMDGTGMTDVRVTGWYEQTRARVRSDVLVVPYLEQALRHQLADAGVAVSSLEPDVTELNAVLRGDDSLEGTVKATFTVVSASGRRGRAIATMEFTGVRRGTSDDSDYED